MKVRVMQAIFLVLFGLISGYVWSDPILSFVHSILPAFESTPHFRTLTYDGWLS